MCTSRKRMKDLPILAQGLSASSEADLPAVSLDGLSASSEADLPASGVVYPPFFWRAGMNSLVRREL